MREHLHHVMLSSPCRTAYDRAYKVLCHWWEGVAEERRGGEKEREALVDVLEAIGCEKCAEFLMLGAIDMLWK